MTLMTEVTTQTFDGALSEIGKWITGSSYEQAMECCATLALSYPDAVRLLRLRATAQELSGQTAQAVDDYRRLLDIIPADALTMVGLARCLANTGQHAESAVYALQSLASLPDDPDALSIVGQIEDGPIGRGQIAEARLAFKGGLTNRAFALIRRLTLAAPDRADAQIALAEMLWRSGFKVSTVELCQSILDAQPDCLNAHVILAAVWAQIGNMDIADLHHDAAERYDPDFRATREWLSDASPFFVRDAVVKPESEPQVEADQPAAQDLDSEPDRSAWVDELIAAAGPVAPMTQASPPATTPAAENASAAPASQNTTDDADADLDAEAEDTIDTTPLEWMPAQPEEPVEDIPAWLTALSAEKAPEMVAEGDPDQPIERADDSLRAARTGTMTKWSPEPPAVVTLDLAPAATNVEVTPASISVEAASTPAPELTVTDEDAGAGKEHSAPAPAVDAPSPTESEFPDGKLKHPARKKVRKSRPAKSKSTFEDALDLAHNALESGDYESAADHYASLIKAGRKLDVLLAELESAARVHPKVRRFQTLLGDVYTRKGDVNAALMAYHRALETTENRETGD